jgi:mannose-1-phosphate guanylyltransferase
MKNNNFCVIMAGGVGSRFWPFSTTKRPKQFLDLFGTGRSLLQMTFDRFSKIVPVEHIFIASNLSYKELILQQLPEIKPSQLLLEPARRNTAPCIAYATNKIMSIDEHANIVISPSDHLILKENEFVDTINKGLEYTATHDCLMTLGIKPSRPETGYGYIQTEGAGENGVFKVKTFTEKPNIEMAKIFLESGDFLWNSGNVSVECAGHIACV